MTTPIPIPSNIAPRSRWGADSAPTDPLGVFKGPTSIRGGRGRGRGGKGKERKRDGRGREEGEGKGFVGPISNCFLRAWVVISLVGTISGKSLKLLPPDVIF